MHSVLHKKCPPPSPHLCFKPWRTLVHPPPLIFPIPSSPCLLNYSSPSFNLSCLFERNALALARTTAHPCASLLIHPFTVQSHNTHILQCFSYLSKFFWKYVTLTITVSVSPKLMEVYHCSFGRTSYMPLCTFVLLHSSNNYN